MQVITKIDRKREPGPTRYFDIVSCDILKSVLVVPKIPTVNDPVTLTINIHFTLNFADSKTGTLRPGVIANDREKYYARDSDGEFFLIKDWDFGSATEFAHKFMAGEKFWDKQFMLIPPDSFDLFDFKMMRNGREETFRPNVLCRFQLHGGPDAEEIDPNRKVHLTIDVLKTEGPNIGRTRAALRSDRTLYDHRDVDTQTLWHELGHAIGEDHIQALLGDATCKMGDSRGNQDRCYVTPPGNEPNVMGKGKGLMLANAKPWIDLIREHTNALPHVWTVTRDIMTPPRRPNPLFL